MVEDINTDSVPLKMISLKNVSRRCHWILLVNRDLCGVMDLTTGSMELMSLKELFQLVPSGQ